MPKIRLTDVGVRSLAPGLYFDDRLSQFGIRVGKSRRTWIVLRGENRTKVRLGHYPALGLSDARRKAMLELGTPFERSQDITFPKALDDFLAQDKWRPRSRYVMERSLRKHFTWTKALDKITRQDISAAIRAIEAPSAAVHAFKDIKNFFNWCVPLHLPHSPCAGLKPPSRYVPRSRLLSDEEFLAIWNAAGTLGAYGALVRALFTTGQRVGQLLAFNPDWVKGDLIVFPREIMKGDAEHRVPFGALTVPLLSQLRTMTYQGKPKKDLDKLSGVKNWTLHDARRFFSSTHARLQTPIDCTEALLSHVSGSRSQIQRVYDHYDRLPELRKAVAAYEQHLENFLRL